MANLALYRKYRPRTFDEVMGQEHVTAPLIQALKNGKLHHAYLFSGPRGCGKTSSARILARSLNCVDGPTPHPCGVCDSCVALAPDGPGSLDVLEIDAASHGGVDDARDLRERAFFAPVSSRYKIYVIDEAHMVSSAGFNALLKLVEEPPEFVKFVFATTEPEKVLTTIRSRTHHYPFRLIPPGVMRGLLEQVCTAEKVTIEPAVLPLVVRAGGGSARDALSLLDQLLAGAGEEGVTYARAVGLLGVTDSALLDEACDALAAADAAALFGTVDRVVEAGHDPRRFAADLLERLRDLLILERVPDAAAKGLIDAPADELERMTGQALRLGAATLTRMAEVAHAGLVEMRGTTSPRLLLELVCARMLLPGADDGHVALLQRLERLERRFEIAGTPPPPAAPAEPADIGVVAVSTAEITAVSPISAESPESPESPAPDVVSDVPVAPPAGQAEDAPPPGAPGPLDAAAVRRVWDQVRERTKEKRRVVWAMLQNATVRDVRGDVLVLSVKHQGEARRLADDQITAVLHEALFEVLGVRWRVTAEADGATPTQRVTPAHSGRPARATLSAVPDPPPTADAAPSPTGWPAVAPAGGMTPSPAATDDVPLPPEPAYEGFDPGDEPADDDGVRSERRDSEAEAIALIERQLGGRRIGD